jgi:hypothetical protein
MDRTGKGNRSFDREIIVKVQNPLNGNALLEFNVGRSESVNFIKRKIRSDLHVPPSCQQLVYREAVLQDSELIRTLCGDEASIMPLIMVVSVDAVCARLAAAPGRNVICALLEDIGELGVRGGHPAINAVSALLEDRASDVRRAAVRALAQVADKGDERAILAVTARIEHSDADVRRAAVETLAEMRKPICTLRTRP